MVSGRSYRIVNLQYRGALLELAIQVLDPQRVRVEGTWSGSVRSVAVKDGKGVSVLCRERDLPGSSKVGITNNILSGLWASLSLKGKSRQ